MFPRLFALNLWWWTTEANAKTRFQRSRGFAYQCTTGVEAASFAEQNSRLPLNWCPSVCAIVQIFHTDGVWSCSKTSTDVRCEPQPDNCAKHDLRLGSTMQDDLLSWSARWIASALFRRM